MPSIKEHLEVIKQQLELIASETGLRVEILRVPWFSTVDGSGKVGCLEIEGKTL